MFPRRDWQNLPESIFKLGYESSFCFSLRPMNICSANLRPGRVYLNILYIFPILLGFDLRRGTLMRKMIMEEKIMLNKLHFANFEQFSQFAYSSRPVN